MSLSIQKAKDLVNNKTKTLKEIDILNEINENLFTYNTAVTIAGPNIEFRKYKGDIFLNYSPDDFENDDSKSNDSNKDNSSTTIFNDNEIFEENNKTTESKTKAKNRNRYNSNLRRSKTLKNLIRCNTDQLNSFLTLTMGDIDYKELLENKISNLEININSFWSFSTKPQKVLELLEGIKKIDKCSTKDKERLNPEYEDIRKNVIEFLGSDLVTGKINKTKKIVYENKKNTHSKKRLNEEIKREIPRQLDGLICNKDPYDIDDANKLFQYFVQKIDRYIEKNKLSSDQKEDQEIDKFKYIKIVELQQNGRIHFHLLSNLPYLKQWELQKLWGNGIVHVSSIHNFSLDEKGVKINKEDDKKVKYNKLGEYFTKEVSSTSQNDHLQGRQLFTTSEYLKRPIKLTSVVLIDYVRKHLREEYHEPIIDRNIISQNEHAKDYKKTIYNIDSTNLYEEINTILNDLVKKMINIAENRGQNKITQDIYNDVIKNETDFELEKDFLKYN